MKKLMANIEKLRNQMIIVGMDKGIGCSQVIDMSQELDLLIVEFQKKLDHQNLNFKQII